MRIAFSSALTLLIILAASMNAFAGPPALKIGIVNMQALIEECDAAKDALKLLSDQFSEERNELEQMAADLQRRAEELQAQSDFLSSETLEEKKREFVTKKRELEDRTRFFARKVETAENRIRQDMQALIYKASQEFAERGRYTILLNGNQAGLLYADRSLDVTEDLLKEVNRIYRATKTR